MASPRWVLIPLASSSLSRVKSAVIYEILDDSVAKHVRMDDDTATLSGGVQHRGECVIPQRTTRATTAPAPRPPMIRAGPFIGKVSAPSITRVRDKAPDAPGETPSTAP